MIKTSDEGTSYCPQCESYAREIEHLEKRLELADKFMADISAILRVITVKKIPEQLQ